MPCRFKGIIVSSQLLIDRSLRPIKRVSTHQLDENESKLLRIFCLISSVVLENQIVSTAICRSLSIPVEVTYSLSCLNKM